LKRIITLFLFLLFTWSLSASSKSKPTLNIRKAESEIKVDGVLDESDWSTANIASDFFQTFPYDTSFAQTKTEVKVTYDDNFIYVGAVCLDETEGDYVIQSLRRDFTFATSDAFSVYLDPFNDQFNGFSFSVSPMGVQQEGLLANGGGFGSSLAWDNKWFVKVKRYPDKWVAEMAIPFKTIRFKEGLNNWGINFARNDLKRNELSTWSPVPRNFNASTLAFTGQMIWDNPPPKAGGNISLIPYGITEVSRDFEPGEKNEIGFSAGGDAKVAITSSLNLDLTINPDFSQVEVDVQQTNLTRFNLFFPERRQFFIENSDLFSQFGFSRIRPFFSRRIGLESGSKVPIYAGARLSGKINKNWRVGLMNMQTASDTALNIKPQNYTVAAVQRQVFSRSNIAAILVNRQGFEDSEVQGDNYNRIVGLDYNLASANNRWRGKIFSHFSLSPEASKNGNANASWINYSTPNWWIMWNHEYVSKSYNAEVGFVPRNVQYDPVNDELVKKTYWRLEPGITRRFYPKSDLINNHGPGLYIDHFRDENLENTDYQIRPYYFINFQNSASIEVGYEEWFTKLFFETDVTFSSGTPIPAGEYTYRRGTLSFTSNQRRKFNFRYDVQYGSYYIGTRWSQTADIQWRKQPWGIFSLNMTRHEIRMPDQFKDAFITLVGPRVELSFTKTLFLTTFFQYNTQIDNFNINSRLQWRFKPMSDLYIVYTDNYDQFLNEKNRALVVKLIWWLTL